MALIAKRRVAGSWRDAVAARDVEGGAAGQALDAFDRMRAAGLGEAESAFRALEQHGLLWRVDLPGETIAAASAAADRENPHEVPAA